MPFFWKNRDELVGLPGYSIVTISKLKGVNFAVETLNRVTRRKITGNNLHSFASSKHFTTRDPEFTLIYSKFKLFNVLDSNNLLKFNQLSLSHSSILMCALTE